MEMPSCTALLAPSNAAGANAAWFPSASEKTNAPTVIPVQITVMAMRFVSFPKSLPNQ